MSQMTFDEVQNPDAMPLVEPPEEEGNDQEAAEGTDDEVVTDDDLEDVEDDESDE